LYKNNKQPFSRLLRPAFESFYHVISLSHRVEKRHPTGLGRRQQA